MTKTARDSQPADPHAQSWPHRPVNARKGTDVMPMPEEAPQVAGMPRRGRAIAEPGDPGVITPEDDVLDTSRLSNPQR
ncbi:hypothetical protein BN113_4060 [Bordetella bronchiseptica 1289]|uniref:hypothetical protein n=1 Tax=Bordetella bronchiseptica TaxID=518 RepID=UPI00029076B9|nr:hypothetical protein [Bordetella bronchiseptica]KDD01213.1 hypothetical protein L521_4199 [Bordetella bronchiseptica MBORD698]CCN24844.1 hypothetical protein BN113_4060 [Bordetella bronchiseptica 1289]